MTTISALFRKTDPSRRGTIGITERGDLVRFKNSRTVQRIHPSSLRSAKRQIYLELLKDWLDRKKT